MIIAHFIFSKLLFKTREISKLLCVNASVLSITDAMVPIDQKLRSGNVEKRNKANCSNFYCFNR